MRPTSLVAPGWWDYTTLDREILDDAARLTAEDLAGLSRDGFQVKIYETLEDFYLAEALEYITAWRQATPDQPTGVCGPIGPTEQLPLVARLVNELEVDLRHCHFWGMDEWVLDGREVPEDFPLSFARTDRELLFNRIRPDLRMPEENIHFPKAERAPVHRIVETGQMPGHAGGARGSEALGFQRSAEASCPLRSAASFAGRIP